MKALILTFLLWIVSPAFALESALKKSPITIVWNSIFHKMTFRDPIVFTPFEVKAGYLYYGGKNYWSGPIFNNSSLNVTDLPVLLDSTQYDFNSIDNFTNRGGLFIEIDFIRTNLPHFIIHQNYIDLQFGLGLQFTDFSSNISLPSESGKEWDFESNQGKYYFHPRSFGLNINTSLGWQLSRSHVTYLYHSLGINSLSLYESEGDKRSVTGTSLSESFGFGTKFIFMQERSAYNYTLGIEVKWNRLYMTSVDAPDGLTPIHGANIRASGIFLTSGIQFGGNHTDGDIAYSQMMQNDFISAAEYFKSFLANKIRHGKRKRAAELLYYCLYQISFQQVNNGIEAMSESDYDQALYWFDLAQETTDENLKEEIHANLQNIATELLDSVENHKNEMSIVNAEKIAKLARELYPESIRYSQVLADLYMDKAKLNTKIGYYSGAIDNYQKALQLYPKLENTILKKLHIIGNIIMKDAYFSYKMNELYMVLKSMQNFSQLQPKIAKGLEPYISKLKIQIEEIHSEKIIKHTQQFIIDKKHESFEHMKPDIQLGMTFEEAIYIKGTPQIIDKHTENKQHFEMWTYSNDKDVSQLFFRNNMLIRIKK